MKNILLIAVFSIWQITISQNGLYIVSGGSLDIENDRITVVNGHVINTSTTGFNGGALQMTSLDGNTYNLELTNPNTIKYLELYGTGTVNFNGQVTIESELFLNDNSSFNLTSGSFVTLGPTAEIVGESDINPISGADGTYITTIRNHVAGITNDFGLIGVETRNGTVSMGSTEIIRKYGAFTIAGTPSVKRYYKITPTVNSGLNLDVRFYLLNDDLNGLNRNNLVAYRSTDNGTTFTNQAGTPNTYHHAVSNIDAFSLWTFSEASALNIDSVDLQSISVFPNPAKSIVNIIPNNNTVVINEIQLYNVLGQQILIKLSNTNTFKVSHLKDGMYFLNIIAQNGGITTKKIMVKK